MRLLDLLSGLATLLPYYGNPFECTSEAEHGELTFPPTQKPLEYDDLSRMISLGFFQYVTKPEQTPFHEMSPDEYNPTLPWHCYV